MSSSTDSTTSSGTVPAQGGAGGRPDLARQIRDAYAAFACGDLEAVRASMTDDCTWYLTDGDNPFTGTYTGWQEIAGLLGRLVEISDGTWRSEVDDVAVATDGQRAAAFVTATSTVKGATLVTKQVVAYYAADGKATQIHFHNDDVAAMDAHLSR